MREKSVVLPQPNWDWNYQQKAGARLLIAQAHVLIRDRNEHFGATPTSLELERELLVALNYDAEE